MSELKTRPTRKSVAKFLDGVEHEGRREDARQMLELMEEITGEKATMWGDSIVGFGRYRYRYASGREGEWLVTGFSPRKTSLTLYIMSGFTRFDELLDRLGKHSTGKSCLYIKRLENVDREVLGDLIRESVAHVKARQIEY